MSDGSLRANYAKWKRATKAYVKRTIRRRADELLPSREIREYGSWIRQRQINRSTVYTRAPDPGLFSILTPVWNGSPVRYLRELAQSIATQNSSGVSEWVVLDNGCSDGKVISYLQELRAQPGVMLIRSDENLGITRGLRRCLEEASGRYVLPVDADDLLYPDALQVIATAVSEAGQPPLLYTDEDKVIGLRRYQPYFKPDWDPVLLLNSAYIAHLGVIDRETALELGAYNDAAMEGSPDWDLFVRFLTAGYQAVHVPEVVYSWRVHASSTADDAASKPYIASSQRAVLDRYLHAHPKGKLFEVEESPLLRGGAHWHFLRKKTDGRPYLTLVPRDLKQCRETAQSLAEQDGLLCLLGEGLQIDSVDWAWEAMGIMDLHPETAMVGARLRDSRGRILEAGFEFIRDGACVNPNRGKADMDPGYFGQIWKQRSVDAVSTRFAVIKARFLLELLTQLPAEASLEFLGAWAGLYAHEMRQRIVYSPFLSGTTELEWDQLVSDGERTAFGERLKTSLPSKGRRP